MKMFLLALLLPCCAGAQNQFCITNETPSISYQYRAEYTCGAASNGQWTAWYEVPSGPSMQVCIVDDDFACPGNWHARTFQVRTGTSNNMVTLTVPENYPGERQYLIDPLNENTTGNIVWQAPNTARIY